MKNLKNFESKVVTNQVVVKGGSNGSGTRKATAQVKQNNALPLL